MHKFILKIVLLALVVCLLPLPAHAEQTITPGNVVNITVLGYPELSTSVLVRPDGTTEYPMLYNVPIDGMTVQELRELILPILTRFVERPYLFINISEHLQLRVEVQGQIKTPGSRLVEGPIDLQGILAIAGGPLEQADLSRISILQQSEGKPQELIFNMYDYLKDRENQEIPMINSGDIIFLPTATSNAYVRVLGAINKPGAYLAVNDENILDLIYIAGGPTRTGNMNNVTYVSWKSGEIVTEVLQLNDMIRKQDTRIFPTVYQGDLIFVAEKKSWEQVDWWIKILRDAVILTSSLVVLSRI